MWEKNEGVTHQFAWLGKEMCDDSKWPGGFDDHVSQSRLVLACFWLVSSEASSMPDDFDIK